MVLIVTKIMDLEFESWNLGSGFSELFRFIHFGNI